MKSVYCLLLAVGFLFACVNVKAAAHAPPVKTEISQTIEKTTNDLSQGIAFHAEASYEAAAVNVYGVDVSPAVSTPAEVEVITPHGYCRAQTTNYIINKFTKQNPAKKFPYLHRCSLALLYR